MSKLVVYVHGKGGNAAGAEHYKCLFKDCDVVGFDYKSQNPWDAKSEFGEYFEKASVGYDSVILIANSIGAFFAMSSYGGFDRAFLISPVVNMEKLICDMMQWANVSEKELEKRQEIPTEFGEILSWKYLSYVRSNPIKWDVPTDILYGENDNLTSLDTICEFAEINGAKLTVMPGGEHWFHTEEQMNFIDEWIRRSIKA